MLLGLFRGASVATTRVELQPGDTLVLVTDGVLEAHRDAGQFGPKGVEAVLQAELGSAGTVATAIEQAVLRHTGGSLNDDLAAVVLQVLSEAEPAGD
jgi:serine phosphatase RsbU (regulator of sigma subunit)